MRRYFLFTRKFTEKADAAGCACNDLPDKPSLAIAGLDTQAYTQESGTKVTGATDATNPSANATPPEQDDLYKQLLAQDFSKQEITEQVLSRIHSLPAKYREVIILHYLEQQSIHDIKATIGMSESTVRNRLGYGLFLLKTQMAKKPKNPV